jgi:DNA-binding response OmpR family regulator
VRGEAGGQASIRARCLPRFRTEDTGKWPMVHLLANKSGKVLGVSEDWLRAVSAGRVIWVAMSQEKKPLGKILLEQRAVSPEQLQRALADKTTSGRLASRLTAQGVIRDVEALKALSEQFGVPGIDLGQICLRLEELDLMPREIAEQHLILPVLARDDQLFVAVANPRETKVLEELEFVTGKKVYPYVALEGMLRHVIEVAYTKKARGELYYVAPRCPAEVLGRLGINPDGTVRDSGGQTSAAPENTGEQTGGMAVSLEPHCPASQRPGSIPDQPVPRATPALIVDDAVRLSSSEDIEENDFGQLSRDLSVVSELPGRATDEPAPTGNRKVLVVDDDLDIRKMVVRLLRTRGLEVLEADRGLLALRLVKEHNPHAILLDAMLPEVHGFEIAKRIKNSKRYGRTPIIMISAVYRGWRFAEDLKQSCGVDHYLEKPFRIEELLRAVDECLSGGTDDLEREQEVKSEREAEAESALNMGVEAYRAGRMEEAIEHLRRGISIDPLAYRLHFHLGLLYGKGGKVFEAISELEAAMDLNSKHFAASKNLAILYQKAGFRNKAAETWERSLRLAPDDETRRTIKDHLLNLL